MKLCDRRTLLSAAQDLREHANELKAGHTIPGTGIWPTDPDTRRAKRDHTRMMRTANRLKVLAAT